MTDAEPLWRRMMELTVAFAAQAKRQHSSALSALGCSQLEPPGPWELEMPWKKTWVLDELNLVEWWIFDDFGWLGGFWLIGL